jgi:hypothetical protein
MGQTVAYKVVPLEDGHYALVGEYDIFPPPTEIELPSGEIGYQQQSAGHRHPLTIGEFHHPDSFSIGIDPTNVGGIQKLEDFFARLKGLDSEEFETQPIERRSLIPDPEVMFTLGLKASAAWFGLRVAKVAADAIEPELKNFFQVLVHDPIQQRERVTGFVNGDNAELFVAEVNFDIVGLVTVRVSDNPDAPMFRPGRRACMDDLVDHRMQCTRPEWAVGVFREINVTRAHSGG